MKSNSIPGHVWREEISSCGAYISDELYKVALSTEISGMRVRYVVRKELDHGRSRAPLERSEFDEKFWIIFKRVGYNTQSSSNRILLRAERAKQY